MLKDTNLSAELLTSVEATEDSEFISFVSDPRRKMTTEFKFAIDAQCQYVTGSQNSAIFLCKTLSYQILVKY